MNAAERTFVGSMRALALVLVLVGCGAATEPTEDVPVEVAAAPLVAAAPSEAAPAVDPQEAEREHVREILLQACGSCHLGASSIQPSALGVFDLGEVDFAARMTDAQLEGVPGRLDGMELRPDDAAAVITYVSVLFAERKADHGCA